MTYTTFIAQVRAELEESAAGIWTDDSLMFWTNEGIYDLAHELRDVHDTVTFSTLAGTLSYGSASIGDDLTIAIDYIDYAYTRLKRDRPYKDWAASGAVASGVPASYSFEGGTIFVQPVPNAVGTVTVRRSRVPTAIAATTDDMPWNGDYAHVGALKSFVGWMAFSQMPDDQTAALAADRLRQRYGFQVDRLKTHLARQTAADTHRVPDNTFF